MSNSLLEVKDWRIGGLERRDGLFIMMANYRFEYMYSSFYTTYIVIFLFGLHGSCILHASCFF